MGQATNTVTECMTTGAGEGLVERPDADSTHYVGAEFIDMTLQSWEELDEHRLVHAAWRRA